MLAVLLLAQVTSATPVPTPAVSLGTASAAVSAKPKTLADLALERKLGKKGVAGTFSVSGATGTPALPANGRAGGDAGESSGEDSSARMRAAQANVQAARRAVDEEAVKKGMTSEDAAAARKRLSEARRELNDAREAAERGH